MTGEQQAYVKTFFLDVLAGGRLSAEQFTHYKSLLVERGVSAQEADDTLCTLSNCLECMKLLGMKPDNVALKRYLAMTNGDPEQLHIICPLHGIRTDAPWHRELSDVGTLEGWNVRQNRWSYGRFRTIWFMLPITRNAKIKWLRKQYDLEKNDVGIAFTGDKLPSVIAHSFGTYILGYALLRYRFIRFNKVILCGSILPVDFPWDKIIERGQVQAVRNEYGIRDPWVKRVRGYISHTGPSGYSGFTCRHERFMQEQLNYDHGEYFGCDHMLAEWFPFLDKGFSTIKQVNGEVIPDPKNNIPWGTYVGLTSFMIAFLLICFVYKNLSVLTALHWCVIGVGLLFLVTSNVWAFIAYSKSPK